MSTDKEKALRKAEKYVLRGNISAAINQFRKVVENDSEDLTSANTLGDLYVRAGEMSAAITHFTQIAGRYRESGFSLKAIGVLKKIARLDETNIQAGMELASLYCERGLLVEARRQYLQIAAASERAGNQQKVREAFQKIAELEPSNTSALLKLAELCERGTSLEEARDWLLMAGQQFSRRDDHDQALSAFLKALELCPDSRPAIVAVTTCYNQKGLVDLAVYTLSEALERNAGDIELRMMLGRTYLSASFPHDAERVFKSLIESDPDACSYLIEVGYCFLGLGDLDDVIRLIDAHLDVLIENGRVSKAVELLKLILARDEGYIGAHKRLAQIFERTNQGDELVAALTALAETAAQQGAEQEAMEALEALEDMNRRRSAGLTDHPQPDNQITLGDNFEFASSIDATEYVEDEDAAWEAVGTPKPEPALHEGLTNLANENVLIHLALKEVYQQAGSISEAATKCVELARIHEARGESSRATDYLAEAHRLTRSNQPLPRSEPPPKAVAGSRAGTVVSQVDLRRSERETLNLQMPPAEYNLSHYLGQLTNGEGLSTPGSESGELEISRDAIAEVDERFQECSGRDASAREIYESYRLAIGCLTKASQHSRVQTDDAVRQKLSRAYLTVVEAFSSLLSSPDGFEYQDLVDGRLDASLLERLSMPLNQKLLLDVSRDTQGAGTVMGGSEQWANRRKVERYAQRLPVLVTANNGNWRELTESLDVSALGMRFRLSHPVESGTALRIQLEMPQHLRLHRRESGIYAVSAVVCHQVDDTGGSRLVGAEFGSVLEAQTERPELVTANSSFYQPSPIRRRTGYAQRLLQSETGILAGAVLA